MRIVQVCPYAMDRPGGVQRHVRDLSAWLAAGSDEVVIVAPPLPGRRPRREGRLIEIGRSRAFGAHGTGFELSLAAPITVRMLAGELHGWGAELVHLHTPWTPAVAGQLWRALRLPAVTTLHATLPEPGAAGPVERYIRWAARRAIRRSRAVVVPSGAPLPMLGRLVPDLAAHVLPPAVDLAPWRDAAAARTGPPALVFLGRLEERKGLRTLLEAWRQAAPQLSGARLTVAGDGPLRPPVEDARLPRLDYVGRPSDAAARRLLGKADLFIAPAPYGESYGLVLAEAMAAGAVPVAAANPGYASVLGEAGADLLVPPGDAAALATKIVDLVRAPERIAAWRDWAAVRAAASDIATVGPRYLALYREVLGRDAAPTGARSS